MRRVAVVSMGATERELPPSVLIDALSDELRKFLGASVEIAPPVVLPSGMRPTGALPVDALLDHLIERSSLSVAASPSWTLGLTRRALLSADGGSIFGAATIGGEWAIVSTARLIERSREVSLTRVTKEALHELGHLAGLGHCSRRRCLMSAAASPTDIDARNMQFCFDCDSRFFAG
jgi:archaemetzincin